MVVAAFYVLAIWLLCDLTLLLLLIRSGNASQRRMEALEAAENALIEWEMEALERDLQEMERG